MRLFRLEIKRILKSRRTLILLAIALLLSVAMAYLPISFEGINRPNEDGTVTELDGLAAIKYKQDLYKTSAGEVTPDRIKSALETYQSCVREYGPVEEEGFPLAVFIEKIVPFRHLLMGLSEAFADPLTGIGADLMDIDPNDIDGAYYEKCAEHLQDVMRNEQRENETAQQKALEKYSELDTPFYLHSGISKDAFDYIEFYILFLAILCVAIAASTFAGEYQTGGDSILRTTKYGHKQLAITKILAAFTLAYLEKFFKKICPSVISMIVVPFCSLVLSVMAAHFVLGPIGWKIGSVISSVVYAGITGPLKIVFGAIFGFVYAPLVITGLHHMSNAIDLQLIADFGGTMLWPMIALSNIAQGSAVLGMIYLQKNDAQAQEVNIPSCISCYLGVTEPAMFGVNLKHSYPFICGMIGSACASIVCVATNSTANAIGVGGLPGILSMQPQSMLTFAICMLIAVAVPFVLTVMVGKTKLQPKEVKTVEEVKSAEEVKSVEEVKSAEVTELKAFATGDVIALKEVNDGVFSAGTMGEGCAIIPENETVYAPADATVNLLMQESRHACGLKLANGAQILLHIGIDTVAMKGDGFEYLVKEGQKVSAGTPLIKFDKKKISEAGYVDTIICVIAEPGNMENIVFMTGIYAIEKETTVAKIE